MKKDMDTSAKYYKFLIFTCTGLYMAMMALKNVYVAEIATIVRAFNSTKSNASMMNTYYFITYAITQFLLGFLIHKLNVKQYLLITIPLSVFTYIVLTLFISEIMQMWWLFLLNGFAQAGVVAGTRLSLGKYLPQNYTAKANALYSVAGGAGFVVSYGFSAVCIEFFSWRVPFFVFSAIFLIILGLYAFSVNLAEKNCPVVVLQNKEAAEVHIDHEPLIHLKNTHSRVIFIVASMFTCFLSAAVRYTVNNWLVLYLHEVFGFPETLSMTVMVVMELMGIIGPIIMIAICDKIKNYIKVMLAFYGLSFLIMLVMSFIFNFNMVVSIILLLISDLFLLAGSAGTSVMCFDMRTEINIGAMSAFTNTTFSLAAGIMPTVGIALVEKFGWRIHYIFNGCTLGILLISLLFFNTIISRQKRKDRSIAHTSAEK